MDSENKFKHYMNEKVRFGFVHILIIASLVLCMAAGIVVIIWSNSALADNNMPAYTPFPAEELPVFSLFTDPASASDTLKSIEPTHTEWTKVRESAEMDGIYFITNDDSSLAVFNADLNNVCGQGFTYENFDHIWVDSQTTDFYTCINIPGETVDLSGYYILVRNDSNLYAQKVIFNCYEAKTVLLKQTIFTGTLLAPEAEIVCENTYLYGQFYGKNITGYIKYFEDIPFTGYDALVNAMIPVNFETRAVKQAAIDSLKAKEPMTYSDYRLDAVLYLNDINKIETLDLSSLAIISLGNDLTYFKNITSLSLRNSCVKTVDMTLFPNLLSLDISYSAIDTWDLSLCPGLGSLSIAGKDISGFDLSKVPGLVYLDCTDCNVNNDMFMKIAQLKKLATLIIADNPDLTETDFTQLTLLAQLNINGAGITELNLSKNIGTLVYLCCSNTAIKELDLSPYINLSALEVYGVEKINVSGLLKKQLTTFLHDETAEIIDTDPPVSTDPLGPDVTE